MVRLGLIGCGEHSEIGHAIPLARYRAANSSTVELVAVCDLKLERAEAFRKKYGFLSAYSDVDAMLSREKLDVCVAVVPVDKISQVGIKLLQLGIPTVVEKPLGGSLEEAKALLDTARSTGTPNMVSVNRRFMPLLGRALDWSRNAGGIRYVRCTMTRHNRTEPEFLWATAVHAVDTLRFIAGDVARWSVRILSSERDSATWYALDFEFENGTHGRIDVMPTAGVLDETYELLGEGFRVVVTSPFGQERGWRAYSGNALQAGETDQGMSEDVVNGFYDEAAALIRAISSGEALHPGIEEVYPSIELCHNFASTVRKSVSAPR